MLMCQCANWAALAGYVTFTFLRVFTHRDTFLIS
ncbi:hypothetical protein HMPREF1214_01136 [Bacteroides sp. HPS0048]|nr:hypothetical protein HMPREF1214_01136 [Bacteroides sp. HPS0048]